MQIVEPYIVRDEKIVNCPKLLTELFFLYPYLKWVEKYLDLDFRNLIFQKLNYNIIL